MLAALSANYDWGDYKKHFSWNLRTQLNSWHDEVDRRFLCILVVHKKSKLIQNTTLSNATSCKKNQELIILENQQHSKHLIFTNQVPLSRCQLPHLFGR